MVDAEALVEQPFDEFDALLAGLAVEAVKQAQRVEIEVCCHIANLKPANLILGGGARFLPTAIGLSLPHPTRECPIVGPSFESLPLRSDHSTIPIGCLRVHCGGQIPLTEEERDEAEPVHQPPQQLVARDHRPNSRDVRLDFAVVDGDLRGPHMQGNVNPMPPCSITCTWNSLGALPRTCLKLRSKDTMETDT